MIMRKGIEILYNYFCLLIPPIPTFRYFSYFQKCRNFPYFQHIKKSMRIDCSYYNIVYVLFMRQVYEDNVNVLYIFIFVIDLMLRVVHSTYFLFARSAYVCMCVPYSDFINFARCVHIVY